MIMTDNNKPNYELRGKRTATYELFFLGDHVGHGPKNRDTLNWLLKEAHQLLKDAAAVDSFIIGEAEIFVRHTSDAGAYENGETVWSMSINEFTKGHRLPIKALWKQETS